MINPLQTHEKAAIQLIQNRHPPIPSPMTQPTSRRLADAIRFLSLDAVAKAKSGHSGTPMALADAATVLFTRIMKYDAAAPDWPDRDRFVLSVGHASMLVYSVLHLIGVKEVTLDQIKAFRQLGSNTPGHPEFGHTPGVETTTGPLGQGIATAVGMAIAEAHLRALHGTDFVDHHTWVFAGDGCLMEGVSHEAIALAGHQKLSRLCVLWDDNAISIDGGLDLTDSVDQVARFAAAGWNTIRVDGHDHDALEAAFKAAKASDRPTLIAAKTRIGIGAPTLEGTSKAHGAITEAAEIAGARANLDWAYGPFEVPDDIVTAWRTAGAAGRAAREAWEARIEELNDTGDDLFAALVSDLDPTLLRSITKVHAENLMASKPALATREASGAALEALTPVLPGMIGGSADLTGSNNTRTKGMMALSSANPSGNYVHWGVREHGMAAAMNGMALHGGVIPYSGTFLVFADYARPAIRLAALMGIRVIHVMTHDSIGLGEDGPTHQPVEHLASLRAMPNCTVFRPCDAVEAAECWELALGNAKGPSIMALSRQKVAFVRSDGSPENRSRKGAYVISASTFPEQAAILATGTEVEIALAAQKTLAERGIGVRVVSMPCHELFEKQSQAYQAETLGGEIPRVSIEAGSTYGWARWVGPTGVSIGIDSFGASAPYQQLYTHFGITAEAVVSAVETVVKA